MHTLLQILIEEFQENIQLFTDGVVERSNYFSEIPNKIRVAIGMRRTGKTYLLWQLIQKLLKDTPISQLLYINFEDNRLLPMNQEKFSNLLDAFYSLYPENHERLCYFFLDEIQNVVGWETVIRRLFDSKKSKIYLTGSSAKLLSKEIATSLRGRSIATEVWPFSFEEYLKARKLELPTSWGRKSIDLLTHHLKSYLHCGGFPEIVSLIETINLAEEDQRRILQDYTSMAVLRDIVERYRITNISLINYLIKMLLKNVGNPFSVHKLFNDLKNQGFSVGKMTIHDYLSYIEDSYLAFNVPLFSESIRKVQTNPRRIYAIDSGLIRANAFGFSENIGHYFENLVYLDLRRAGHTVYYYLTESQPRLEVDFMTQDPRGQFHLYQVCWDTADAQTLARKKTALSVASKELKIDGQLITPETYFKDFL